MSPAELQQLIEQIKTLTPEEQRELRRTIDALTVEDPEDELDRRLLESGLVSQLPSRTTPRSHPEPVRIEGKPLSQTIIEERR